MTVLQDVKKAIEIEAAAVKALAENVGPEFEEAIKLIQNCTGKVIVTGVGKSGHVGKKIAASLASTGTPAFFVHSTEGVHGDLGMIEEKDVVIMISNSGETAEVLNLLPSLSVIKPKKIAITKNADSSMAKACDVALTYKYETEADHLGLAPTTSSTLALVIGDALAVGLCKAQGFTKENFHLYHPGGSLGKQLSR
ncbi:KpsF/GutQ family sugar-phosphate isomerase [Lederbergia graminis]|uniref:SIS domain-containing protein n=1 Tax=Lederbergia graminis TaxID=735518 RepID=A0ABW0LI84_9BACI